MEKGKLFLDEMKRDRFALEKKEEGYHIHTYRYVHAGLLVYVCKYWI